MKGATLFSRTVSFLAVALLSFVPCARGRHSARANHDLNSRPCEDPAWIAAQDQAGFVLAKQIMAASMPWAGEKVNEYVDHLGQRLARISGSNQAFTFRVLYAHEINAQSVPGGYVFVNTGVISRAESEAELAAVLAHEIAHENTCFARNPSQASGFWGRMAGEGRQSGLAKSSVATRRVAGDCFGESVESEADELAVSYLARAGYDPNAVLQVLARVEAEKEEQGKHGVRSVSAKPSSTLRRSSLERILSSMPPSQAAPGDSAKFNEVRAQIRAYDEVYSRALDVPLPGQVLAPPQLRRRPVAGPSQ